MLLKIGIRYSTEYGAVLDEADLGKLDLPPYNADVEAAGIPAQVQAFNDRIRASDVILLASPEYNYSVPGVLKNAIDWASRSGNAFACKHLILCGASTGPYGTLRGQFQMRLLFTALNVVVLPQPQVLVPYAEQAFNNDGTLKDKKIDASFSQLIRETFATAERAAGVTA